MTKTGNVIPFAAGRPARARPHSAEARLCRIERMLSGLRGEFGLGAASEAQDHGPRGRNGERRTAPVRRVAEIEA